MTATLLSLISLFVSCFILLLGNGLMNVLMPVRMGLDGMGTDTIGMVQSLYFVGLVFGAAYSKYLIIRAGHIRMFAGCVSFGAATMLACALFEDVWLWGAMRLLLGFCNACAFTAMESWLSDASSKENRGKVLAFYNATVLSGLFVGQFFLNLADPGEATLFIAAGVMLSLAVIPVALSRLSGPPVEDVTSMPLSKLFKVSPLGVVTCLVSGIIYSAVFNLLPVFANEYAITGFQLSLYMGAAIFGAFILQFPVGYLSDRFDRRTVLAVLLIVSSLTCVLVAQFALLDILWAVFLATAITSGIIACTYPVSISEVFDKLRQSEMVAAMGSMIVAFSVGGIIGPYSVSLLMQAFGNNALFYTLAAIQIALVCFVLYRMRVREALPVEDQENFVMQGVSMPAAVELDPRTEYVETEQPLSPEAQTLQRVAEQDSEAAIDMVRMLIRLTPERAAELAGAVAITEKVDVIRLYATIRDEIPDEILTITSAIVTARPEIATDLVSHLAIWYPDQVVSVAAEIGRTFPEWRVEMARVASEAAPETAIEVAEYYAQVFAEEREALRPADRQDDTSEEDAVGVASEIWDVAPEQALEVAATMVDAVPEAAASVAEEYLSSESIAAVAEQQAENTDGSIQEDNDTAYPQEIELVTRLAEVAPEQAVDVAVAVVEVEPESAPEVAAELASSLSTAEESVTSENPATETEQEYEEIVELATRLAEAAPEQALDVAVAVVEAEPESAAAVATEIAGSMSDTQENTDTTTASDTATSDTAQIVTEASAQDSDSEYAASVELVSRLVEVAPEHAVDVAVAVVEVEPESAAEVAAEVSSAIAETESTETDTMASDPHETQEASQETGGSDDTTDHETAIELVQRLSEAVPDSAIDVAVAVVENIPEVASDLVDVISEGDQAKDQEWMNDIKDKPDQS